MSPDEITLVTMIGFGAAYSFIFSLFATKYITKAENTQDESTVGATFVFTFFFAILITLGVLALWAIFPFIWVAARLYRFFHFPNTFMRKFDEVSEGFMIRVGKTYNFFMGD